MAEWISVKDRMPTEFGVRYLIARFCPKCIEKIDHGHHMVYRGPDMDIALWSAKNMTIVNWYNAQGDHSWDFCKEDRWAETCIPDEEITHWMAFPNFPERN